MKLPDDKVLPMVMALIKVRVVNLLDTTEAEIAAVINSVPRNRQNPLAGHPGPAGSRFSGNWPGNSGSLLFGTHRAIPGFAGKQDHCHFPGEAQSA